MKRSITRRLGMAAVWATTVLVAEACTAQALNLLIDPTSGSVALHNPSFSVKPALDGYTIQSFAGSLSPGGLNGLAAHGFSGWQSVGPSTTVLSELNLSSSLALRIGGTYGLGSAFTPSSLQDVLFAYSSPGSPNVIGNAPVIYTNVVQLRVIALLNNGGATIASTAASIVNGMSASTSIDGYTISSVSGSLSTAGFNGFAGRGVSGWQSIAPSANSVSELNLNSSTTLSAANGVQVLGGVFASGAAQDLAFTYTIPSSTSVFSGPVIYKAQLAGDVNEDGVVNIFDINLISSNWSTAGPTGDGNYDGVVNIFDINFVSSNWNNTLGPGNGGGAIAPVPEPATWALMAIGFVLLCARDRRRRRIHAR